MGRPTDYTLELGEEICAAVAEGASLRQVAKDVGFATSTICLWLAQNKDFSEQYAKAKHVVLTAMADDIIEIADEAIPGASDAARLQVDVRKWLLSKLLPKKYGEQLSIEHTGTVRAVLGGADA